MKSCIPLLLTIRPYFFHGNWSSCGCLKYGTMSIFFFYSVPKFLHNHLKVMILCLVEPSTDLKGLFIYGIFKISQLFSIMLVWKYGKYTSLKK